GVGVGPGAMEALPPPPQPELRAIATNTRPVTNNRITGDNECVLLWFIILWVSPGGDQVVGTVCSVLSPPSKITDLWLWLCDSCHLRSGTAFCWFYADRQGELTSGATVRHN